MKAYKQFLHSFWIAHEMFRSFFVLYMFFLWLLYTHTHYNSCKGVRWSFHLRDLPAPLNTAAVGQRALTEFKTEISRHLTAHSVVSRVHAAWGVRVPLSQAAVPPYWRQHLPTHQAPPATWLRCTRCGAWTPSTRTAPSTLCPAHHRQVQLGKTPMIYTAYGFFGFLFNQNLS